MDHPYLSVILPAFNEATSIYENTLTTVEELTALGLPFEVIVVDDGSTDGTAAEALRAAAVSPQIRVISYQPNRGKGHAVLTGARTALGHVVGFIDADLDLHPRQLGLALETLESSGADLVLGSKWHPGSVVHFPWFRRILSFGYYCLIRFLFNLPVRDTQTGLKLYRRELVQRLVQHVVTRGWAFDLEMLVLAHRWGYRIADMPVQVTTRRKARIRLKDVLAISRETFGFFWRLRFSGSEESNDLPDIGAESGTSAKVGQSS